MHKTLKKKEINLQKGVDSCLNWSYNSINKNVNELRKKIMQRTGLKFKWETGSKNDNAIKIFRERKIPYQYSSYFELEADFTGDGLFQRIDYEALGNGEFEILAETSLDILYKVFNHRDVNATKRYCGIIKELPTKQ